MLGRMSRSTRSALAILLVAAACEKAGAPAPPAAAPPPDAAPAAAVEPVDRCRGSDLDLSALARLGLCESREDRHVSLETSWRTSLDPDPVEVRSGQSVTIRLVFTNIASSALELRLDHTLISLSAVARAYDEHGSRRDVISRTDACEGGWGTGASDRRRA